MTGTVLYLPRGEDGPGYYALLFHNQGEYDHAGPFQSDEDAEMALQRALKIGGDE